MDCGSVYIKMCKKAEEIQSLIKNRGTREVEWNECDVICLGTKKRNRYKVFAYNSCSHSEGFIEPEIYSSYCIWLPRQDQLQAMLNPPYDYVLALYNFIHYCQDGHIDKSFITSMEQLWLAFVMSKHQKIWNGEDWITAEHRPSPSATRQE